MGEYGVDKGELPLSIDICDFPLSSGQFSGCGISYRGVRSGLGTLPLDIGGLFSYGGIFVDIWRMGYMWACFRKGCFFWRTPVDIRDSLSRKNWREIFLYVWEFVN